MAEKKVALERIKLTQESVAAIPLVEAGKRYVYDTDQPGFCVRVTPLAKFYAVRIKIGGTEYQRSIAKVTPGITAGMARSKARTLIGELHNGVDKSRERREKKRLESVANNDESAPDLTVAEALEDYFTRVTKRTKPLKESTKADYRYILNNELVSIKDEPLKNVTRESAERLMASITENRGVTRAVHGLRLLRALCKKNPKIVSVGWADFFPKLPARETDLRHADGRLIYSELLGMGKTHPGSVFGLAMLLTGCRPGELRGVLVGDVDELSGSILLKDTKNRTDHRVYLSTQAAALIMPLLKDRDGDPRPTDAALFQHHGDPRPAFRKVESSLLDQWLGQRHITSTDFRKLCAITLTHLGFPHAVVKGVINHKPDSRDVTMTNYIRVPPEDLKRAWQALGDYYSTSAAKVIQLPTPQQAAA